MADHTRNALRAAARSMDEVIIAAIAPGHPLANEQARLISKYFKLFEARLEYAYDRNRFELKHYIDVAATLLADARALSPAIAQALDAALDQGRRLHGLPGARLSHLQAAAQDLAGLITALIRTAADADPVPRQRIEASVLLASKSLLDAQRAWFLPMAWEPNAAAVPSIEQALGLSDA